MHWSQNQAPSDASARRAAPPVVVYAVDKLPAYDRAFYNRLVAT
jgi:hypothetical protein